MLGGCASELLVKEPVGHGVAGLNPTDRYDQESMAATLGGPAVSDLVHGHAKALMEARMRMSDDLLAAAVPSGEETADDVVLASVQMAHHVVLAQLNEADAACP